ELRELFRKLARSGTGLLLVTHHLPDIVPEIERVLLLKDGRVFRDGAKQDVLTASTLSDLFNLCVDLVHRDGYYHLLYSPVAGFSVFSSIFPPSQKTSSASPATLTASVQL